MPIINIVVDIFIGVHVVKIIRVATATAAKYEKNIQFISHEMQECMRVFVYGRLRPRARLELHVNHKQKTQSHTWANI